MNNNCRICFGEDIKKNLISPCLCSGNIKYVHENCLNIWRNIPSSNNKNFYSCEICKEDFILEINKEFISKLKFKYRLCIGIEILSIILILLTITYFIGKLNNTFVTKQISIINNQIINDIFTGLFILFILCIIVGYISIIYSNRFRVHNEFNINYYNYSPNINQFMLIIVIIGVLIIIYFLIMYFITIRKEYFLNKELSNKYIVRNRDRNKNK